MEVMEHDGVAESVQLQVPDPTRLEPEGVQVIGVSGILAERGLASVVSHMLSRMDDGNFLLIRMTTRKPLSDI